MMSAISIQDIPDKLHKLVLAITCLAVTVAFTAYMLTGSYMRLSGDDYCYNAVEAEQGFWKTQVYSYSYGTELGSNGYSLTFISSLSSQAGVISSSILPSLVLILWLAGGYLLLREVSRLISKNRSGDRVNTLDMLLVSGIITFFTLYLAPNLGQSFYWRSGLLTYLMPLTFINYLTAYYVHVVQSQHQKWWTWIPLFFLAFLGGGFSEAITPMQLGLFSLVLVILLIIAKIRRQGYQSSLKPLSAILIGTLLALVIMVLSPVNHLRQQALPPPPGFARLIAMSFVNAFVFYKISVYKQLLPEILCGLAALALAFWFYIRQPEQISREQDALPVTRVILVSVGLIFAGFLLIVCIMAPVAYGISSYPDSRTLIVPSWIMVIQITSLGWLAGWAVSRWLKPHLKVVQLAKVVGLIIILGMGIFSLVTASNVYAKVPQYQRWASFWDMRNAQIIQAKMDGQTVVHVMELDHIIEGLSELKADPYYWYNVCAERYYGIERLYADQPGWDK